MLSFQLTPQHSLYVSVLKFMLFVCMASRPILYYGEGKKDHILIFLIAWQGISNNSCLQSLYAKCCPFLFKTNKEKVIIIKNVGLTRPNNGLVLV